MYKWQLALITGILLLSACNSNSVEESDMNKEKTHEVSQSSDEKEANSNSGNHSVPVQNIANDKISNEKDLSSLPEYGKIIELIGDQIISSQKNQILEVNACLLLSKMVKNNIKLSSSRKQIDLK